MCNAHNIPIYASRYTLRCRKLGSKLGTPLLYLKIEGFVIGTNKNF